MKPYELIWAMTAEQQLAEVWLTGADRRAITAAANWLEERMAMAPLRLGQPGTSSVQRVAFRDPLGIEFEVIEDDKRVIVLAVWNADRGRSDPTGH
jgi:plasmid stabilization system protein ParE